MKKMFVVCVLLFLTPFIYAGHVQNKLGINFGYGVIGLAFGENDDRVSGLGHGISVGLDFNHFKSDKANVGIDLELDFDGLKYMIDWAKYGDAAASKGVSGTGYIKFVIGPVFRSESQNNRVSVQFPLLFGALMTAGNGIDEEVWGRYADGRMTYLFIINPQVKLYCKFSEKVFLTFNVTMMLPLYRILGEFGFLGMGADANIGLSIGF